MKYVHTNIISSNWQLLADFYIQVFECTPVPPARDQSGAWLDQCTGVQNAHIQGMHLRLPGCGLLEKVLKHGGSKQGEISQKLVRGVGFITLIYAKDPEGNIIEIQNWDRTRQ